jgi:shikimate kinase
MQLRFSENVFLTGFMGVGKTTVGRLLAELVNCRFIDLDELIVRREKRSIAEIFSESGESYFRDCESKLLYELDASPAKVYATGGGIVMREENRVIMRKLGKIVYLNSSWSALQGRLQRSKDRPLVDQEKGWVEVRKLWVRRQPFYADADLVVLTEGCSPLQVAEKIAEKLTGNQIS